MNNKTLTLTIVIPVYNEQGYLKACLNSIVKQSVMPDEVIVVDNNSTDKSAQIASAYPFVRLINETKQGVVFARNTGFNAAKSDIIGRIDADSVLPDNWVQRVLAEFQDPGVAAVTGPVSYYDMPLPRLNYQVNHLMCKFTHRWSKDGPFLYGSNMAIRRNVWERVKKHTCLDQDMHEDIDLAIHLLKADYPIDYTKKILAKASGRRANDSWSGFVEYVAMHRRAYTRHNLHNFAMYFAMLMWLMGYFFIHPWRDIWYSIYSRSKKHYPFTRKVRKNPMSS